MYVKVMYERADCKSAKADVIVTVGMHSNFEHHVNFMEFKLHKLSFNSC